MTSPTIPSTPIAAPARAGLQDVGHSGAGTGAGTAMAFGSIVLVQIGLATSVGLFDRIGPAGAAWLRLAWAAVLLLAWARPKPSDFTRSSLLACIALGLVTGGITLLFMAAIARIPMGTASALEFLGPLAVAVARSRRGTAVLWPVLGAIGVLLLTQPWHGDVDLLGTGLALGAAGCWAAYILLTQRIGDQVSGLRGLAVSMPVAALLATAVAAPSVAGELTWQLVLIGLGLAVLTPVVPFSLELLALRRLTTASFGTLMSLEPAVAVLAGLILLHQSPGWAGVAGIGFVVAAGIGAQREPGRAAPSASRDAPSASRATPSAGGAVTTSAVTASAATGAIS